MVINVLVLSRWMCALYTKSDYGSDRCAQRGTPMVRNN
jgi:hypothetical protein